MAVQQHNLYGMMKASVNPFVWFFLIGLILTSCHENNSQEVQNTVGTGSLSFSQVIQGETQGTTYTILFADSNNSIAKTEIDSLLLGFDLELSGYIDSSLLTRWNNNEIQEIPESNQYFDRCLKQSREVYETTQGYFDPTVFPLIQLWGFFKKDYKVPSADAIDSVLHFVGLHQVIDNGNLLSKKDPRLSLDFNAIAQGLAVDVVSDFIQSKGYQNYYVEIGGELFVSGCKPENKPWVLGIDVPDPSNAPGASRQVQKIIGITNGKGVATSGDYRKSFTYEGKKFAHAIMPSTGRPVQHNLLSVTVIAKDAAMADAYATAFLVMGEGESIGFIQSHPELNLEAYFISSDSVGNFKENFTPGFSEFILQ